MSSGDLHNVHSRHLDDASSMNMDMDIDLDAILSQAGRLASVMRQQQPSSSSHNNTTTAGADYSEDEDMDPEIMEAMLARAEHDRLLKSSSTAAQTSASALKGFNYPSKQDAATNKTTAFTTTTPPQGILRRVVATVSLDEDDHTDHNNRSVAEDSMETMLLKAQFLSRTIRRGAGAPDNSNSTINTTMDTPELLRMSDNLLHRHNIAINGPSPPADTPELLAKANRFLAPSPDTIDTIETTGMSESTHHASVTHNNNNYNTYTTEYPTQEQHQGRPPRPRTSSEQAAPTPQQHNRSNTSARAELVERLKGSHQSTSLDDAIHVIQSVPNKTSSPTRPAFPNSVSLQTIDSDDVSSVGSDSCQYMKRASFLETLNNASTTDTNATNGNNTTTLLPERNVFSIAKAYNANASPERFKTAGQKAQALAQQMAQALEETLSGSTSHDHSPIFLAETDASAATKKKTAPGNGNSNVTIPATVDQHVAELRQFAQLSSGSEPVPDFTQKMKEADKNATWVQVQSAKPGDADYAPLKDYLKTSPPNKKSKSLMVGTSPPSSPLRRFKTTTTANKPLLRMKKRVPELKRKRFSKSKRTMAVVAALLGCWILYWLISNILQTTSVNTTTTTDLEEQFTASATVVEPQPAVVVKKEEDTLLQKRIEKMEREIQQLEQKLNAKAVDKQRKLSASLSEMTSSATMATTPVVVNEKKPPAAAEVLEKKKDEITHNVIVSDDTNNQVTITPVPHQPTVMPSSSTLMVNAIMRNTYQLMTTATTTPPVVEEVEERHFVSKKCFVPLAHVVSTHCRKASPVFDIHAITDSMLQ